MAYGKSQWTQPQAALSIAWKEMYAILAACSTWGHLWACQRILFHCNNTAVVAIWQKGSCRSPHLISLVHNLFFMAATGNYHVGIPYIQGVDNCIADHLSRLSMQEFRLTQHQKQPQSASLYSRQGADSITPHTAAFGHCSFHLPSRHHTP